MRMEGIPGNDAGGRASKEESQGGERGAIFLGYE